MDGEVVVASMTVKQALPRLQSLELQAVAVHTLRSTRRIRRKLNIQSLHIISQLIMERVGANSSLKTGKRTRGGGLLFRGNDAKQPLHPQEKNPKS
jgi:hypothetical protein